MPFLDILYQPSAVPAQDLPGIRDALRRAVGDALSRHDPEHPVTQAMVDARVCPVGPYDVLHVDMLVSVRARAEQARAAARHQILTEIERCGRANGTPPNTMVELVLTERSSLYRYEHLARVPR